MLAAVGIRSVDDLLVAIPERARRPRLGVPVGLSELELHQELSRLAAQDRPAGSGPFFLGAGVYRRYIPAAVPVLAARGEFLTAYTPYQPEVSQGTLQAIWEYQSLVAELLGFDVSNASMYDGSTALAEAALLAVRATGRRRVVVAQDVHPHARAVLRAYAHGPDLEIVEVADSAALTTTATGAACLISQNPSFFGTIVDLRAVADAAHAAGALAVASVEPVSCALLEPPGACGIDVGVGDGQPLGIPMSFGGPSVGMMAATSALVRQLPGRIVGATKDENGTRGFVNTLQTREQHIRREKATSNICTNEAVYAIHAAVYLALMGPRGLASVAARSVEQAHRAAERLAVLPGCAVTNDGPFFCEFTLRTPLAATALRDALLHDNITAGYPLGHDFPDRADEILVCCTELTSDDDVDRLAEGIADRLARARGLSGAARVAVEARAGVTRRFPDSGATTAEPALEPLLFELERAGRGNGHVPSVPLPAAIPERFRRSAPPRLPELAEQQVVRHFTHLAQLNYAVDVGFYPLGSCTMKYNPKINDRIAALPGFADLHPLQPDADTQGALRLIWELERLLAGITGMPEVSLQPAAGAHAEFTAILMFKAYHASRGEAGKRRRVIVPDSAHGTNPSSAAMCGFDVTTVPSDARGNVDLAALETVLGDDVVGMMLTNPNTLGLFEERLEEVIAAVHRAGGLMYGDGANMNALLGIARPGDLGFDVIHLNLHKTFSTPHGAGGPGAGPVLANEKLAPFLPVPRVVREEDGTFGLAEDRPRTVGRVRAFHGNYGVLVRAYSYIRNLGEEGLRACGEEAILAANYLLSQLRPAFEVAYDRPCMHEFVLSADRQKKAGASALDIAKALIDEGFHPPTVYFPLIVSEALMIEPTETEPKETLDAFAAALRRIADRVRSDPASVHDAPRSAPLRRLDEVGAARRPRLRWQAGP